MRENVEEVYTVERNGETKEVRVLYTQFSPEKGIRVATKVSKQVGGPFGTLVSGIKSLQMDDEVDLSFVGNGFESFFSNLNEDEIINVSNLLLEPVLIDGKKASLNSSIFQGDYKLLFKIVKKSAEVNFSDFFEGTSGVVEKIKKTFQTLARQTSTGLSGE